ncbi:MAG: ATP-dependent 6-phosphofructokinase [Candidatus Omnitrophica bacterium]|nr:ATP-dependent 6-phosphofructokinase [Candidatus Omnitrophota bacterium]
MKISKVRKIGILTAGGDCPGLNCVIRVIVKAAISQYGIEVIGFRDGYDGLVKNEYIALRSRDVSGIINLGGTILGTSNIANPYRYPVTQGKKLILEDRSKDAIANYKENSLDCLIAIGGDGTLSIASKLIKDGLNIVGCPKTIDNDLSGTDITFGFESAVVTATDAIDKLHSTAQSHHRVMIIEVMGRYAGWIALYSGIAGGGDIILIPEIPYDMKKIAKKLEERHKVGKRFSIIVIAEGAKPKGGKLTVAKIVEASTDQVRLGGVGSMLANAVETMTGLETRATILGHLQRGGAPTPFDRNLATRYGYEALKMAVGGKFGCMAALERGRVTSVPISKAIGKLKTVPLNHPFIETARAIGTSFGN